MGLLHIPHEILVIVLSQLDFIQDLVACRLVCHRINSVILRSLVLQYKITLAAYGLRDNEFSASSVGEKLQRAHLFHRACRDISWVPHFTLRFDKQHLDLPSCPLVLRDLEGPGSLLMIYSGSIKRNVSDRHWVVTPPGSMPLFAYTFNMVEDLLILQTSDVPKARFYFLSMSTGNPHPQAAVPYLESETIALDQATYGQYAFIYGTNNLHYLWNWKTGQLVTKIRCYYYAAGFLNDQYFAIVHTTDNGVFLHVYHLPCVILQSDTGPMNLPHYVFGLPALALQRAPENCSLKCGFPFSHASGNTHTAGDFYTDPDEGLLTIEYAQQYPQLQYELFVRLRALLALLTPERYLKFTEWSEWGPRNSHATPLLRYPPIVGWRSHSTFGMRRIGMYPSALEDGTLMATIYDYHPRRVALARREPPAEDGRWAVVDGETVSGDWCGAQGGLETRLSYVRVVVPLPQELQQHRGSMVTLGINDDGIVACTEFVASRPKAVHVYTI